MLLLCTMPTASIAAYSDGSRSAISPCHARSMSPSVEVFLNVALAAFDPNGLRAPTWGACSDLIGPLGRGVAVAEVGTGLVVGL